MATKRGQEPGVSTAKSDFLKRAHVEPVSAPASTANGRDYTKGKTGSEIEGLNDQVWLSYQTGEYMIVGCPENLIDYVKSELLEAKNYLNRLHHDEVGPSGMKGVDSKKVMREVNLTDPSDPRYLVDRARREEYAAKAAPFDFGVIFQAHPPRRIGRAAMDQAARKAAEDKNTATQRRRAAEARAAKAALDRGARTKNDIRSSSEEKTHPLLIPFSNS